MYDFVYVIDFGNTSTTYYSCLSLNCSPMINLGINGPYKSAKNLPVFLMSNYYKNNKNII
jgi:hypothetical protein